MPFLQIIFDVKFGLTLKISQSLDYQDMAPKNLLKFTDPTFQFCLQTLVSVLFVTADEATKTLTIGLPSLTTVFDYFFNSWFLIGFCVLAVSLYTVRNCDRELTWSESLIANWYLWNVVVIHVMLDGLCGAHGFGGKMNDNYRILDKRPDLIGQPLGPLATDRALVYTLNEMELFGHSVLCLIAFYGVCYKTPWRHTMETIALMIQAVGAVAFVMPDMLTGCENMQPINVKTCLPPLEPFYFFFFYFGVIINWLWVVVPVFALVKVVQSDVAEKEMLRLKQD